MPSFNSAGNRNSPFPQYLKGLLKQREVAKAPLQVPQGFSRERPMAKLGTCTCLKLIFVGALCALSFSRAHLSSSKAWVAPPGSGHIFLREVCTLLVCRPCPPSSFRTQLLKRYHCFDEDFPPDGSPSNRPDLPLD